MVKLSTRNEPCAHDGGASSLKRGLKAPSARKKRHQLQRDTAKLASRSITAFMHRDN